MLEVKNVTWAIDAFSVEPQKAHDELMRVESEFGAITPRNVLEASEAKTAVLHSEFEWRDDVAANQYRISQSARLIRALRVEYVKAPERQVRAFQVVTATEPESNSKKEVRVYKSTEEVMSDPFMRAERLESAMRELASFRRKYDDLKELCALFAELDNLAA